MNGPAPQRADRHLETLIERVFRRLAAVRSDSLRALAAASELTALTPSVAAAFLGRVVREARDRRIAADALAAVNRALARGDLEPELVEATLACARSRADRLVEALLAAGPAIRVYDQNDEQFVDRRMRSLTLGERRALSKSRDIDKLLRLAHDQDPRVIQGLLQNPRLTEREAVIIASRRPTHAHVLEAVLASRFGMSRRVRRAVAHNPYSSVSQAARAMTTLTSGELRLLATDERVAEPIRRHAAALRAGRRTTAAERDRVRTDPGAGPSDEIASWIQDLEASGDGESIEVVAIDIDGRPVDA